MRGTRSQRNPGRAEGAIYAFLGIIWLLAVVLFGFAVWHVFFSG